MKFKLTRLVPLSAIRDYYHKKYFRRFEPEEFRREMRDHINGGPEQFADWQFRRMAKLKADCYADGLAELDKAKAALEKLAGNLPADKAGKLLAAAEQLDRSALLFVEAALGKKPGS